MKTRLTIAVVVMGLLVVSGLAAAFTTGASSTEAVAAQLTFTVEAPASPTAAAPAAEPFGVVSLDKPKADVLGGLAEHVGLKGSLDGGLYTSYRWVHATAAAGVDYASFGSGLDEQADIYNTCFTGVLQQVID